MVRSRFRTESEVSARERGSQFRYQFLHAVALSPKRLPRFAVAAVRFGRPMPGFMCARAVVVEWRKESGKRRPE